MVSALAPLDPGLRSPPHYPQPGARLHQTASPRPPTGALRPLATRPRRRSLGQGPKALTARNRRSSEIRSPSQSATPDPSQFEGRRHSVVEAMGHDLIEWPNAPAVSALASHPSLTQVGPAADCEQFRTACAMHQLPDGLSPACPASAPSSRGASQTAVSDPASMHGLGRFPPPIC
jgi:hypothetical protein